MNIKEINTPATLPKSFVSILNNTEHTVKYVSQYFPNGRIECDIYLLL